MSKGEPPGSPLFYAIDSHWDKVMRNNKNMSCLYLVFNIGVALLFTIIALYILIIWFDITQIMVRIATGILLFVGMLTLEERYLSKYINRFVGILLKSEKTSSQ
jgi:small neutral amino acid transporter SnatA (MarC family)